MTANPAAFGTQLNQPIMDNAFLTGPGEMIVLNTIQQMLKIPAFLALFGPSDPKRQDQRWADYQRYDWSLRQLPAINIFESGDESKQSDQAFLTGNVQFQVFWPPSQRRNDMLRVERAFKGAIENFFSSAFCQSMLDELYWIQRPEKVYGLNEWGRTLTWLPNTEGLIETQLVPVTILNVAYKIDLRAWYRALDFMGRTKGNPFAVTLADLKQIGGEYDGIINNDPTQVEAVVVDQIEVSNP